MTFAIGQQAIPWPGLHNQIAITLYNDKPYAAVWVFQPLATGTAILVAAVIGGLLARYNPAQLVRVYGLALPWSLTAPAGWLICGALACDTARLHLTGHVINWKGRPLPKQVAPSYRLRRARPRPPVGTGGG